MTEFVSFFNQYLHIKNDYIIYLVLTLFFLLILKIVEKIIGKINQKFIKDEKRLYTIHKHYKNLLTAIYIVIIIIIWQTEFKEIITFISFISAAITLAAREIIYNYFCGIYIKISKPIKIEERVKIGDVIGDIVNINALNFELLEVDAETNQSTGKIIHIPNSQIFNSILKNYNTAFKYIWDEISINVA